MFDVTQRSLSIKSQITTFSYSLEHLDDDNLYRKIPITSPGLKFVQKVVFVGLFSEGLFKMGWT